MKTLQQRFIYYNDLNELHEVENKPFLKSYWKFVQEFVNEQIAKKHNIINSLNVIKKSFNDLMIIEKNETENKY